MTYIAKTEQTLELEQQIYKATQKTGVFCCFEVTIGFRKDYTRKEIQPRVDYVTYDTKGTWRCYEIKVSKADFYSKAEHTFVGHYNYYVMPQELYEQVKEDIPAHVGVYAGQTCIKNPKKQELGVPEDLLKDSLIRSLTRYFQRSVDSDDKSLIEKKNRTINRLHKEKETYYRKYWDLVREVEKKYGTRWNRD